MSWRMMVSNTWIASSLSLFFSLSACRQAAVEPTSEPTPEPVPVAEPAPVPEPEPEPEPPPREWDTALTHSARVLAGMDVPEDSPLYALTQKPEFVAMKKELDASWKAYEDKDRADIGGWTVEHLKEIPPGPVFYPFSGPDILNAVTFLPQGTRYMMFGLEPVGEIPRLGDVPAAEVLEETRKIKGALTQILGMNFFHTKIMAVNVGDDRFNGVAGVLCWFLARTGHDVLEAREVALTAEGEVAARGEVSDPKAVVGVEITFRRTGETSDKEVKQVLYFPGDISDDGWSKRPGLSAYLMEQGGVVTFLKAASYLMFVNSFDDVRSAILARSVAIVQDSSGIPYHHFTDPAKWDTRLYGTYVKPIDLFAVRCEPDLVKDSAAKSLGQLPFSFGYAHWQPHLLYALRAAGRELETPTYDGVGGVGENTYCNAGQLVVEKR